MLGLMIKSSLRERQGTAVSNFDRTAARPALRPRPADPERFLNLRLRSFIVIDLKKGDFKPEYAEKMNFYCSAVDNLFKHPTDQPTIGLILCQTKDKIIAQYALRNVHTPIGVSEYELTRAWPANLQGSLPSIEALKAELSHPNHL